MIYVTGAAGVKRVSSLIVRPFAHVSLRAIDDNVAFFAPIIPVLGIPNIAMVHPSVAAEVIGGTGR